MQQCFPDGKLQAEMTQDLNKDFKEEWNTHNFIKVHSNNNTWDKLLMFIEHTHPLKNDILSCSVWYGSGFFKQCLKGYIFYLAHRELSMKTPLTITGGVCLIPH